jgi:hypothetical protein
MSKINDRARSAGSDGEPPRETLRQRITRLRVALQDCLWRADEKWAADHGWTSQRSASGWSIRVRDPRFDLRQECWECGGTGHHRITGAECDTCDGTGVVTLADDEPDDEPDDEGGRSS